MKKNIVRKKRVSKSEVKLVGDRKKKILSKDGRSCRVPNVTENRESVFGNVVLNGSISSLIIRMEFFPPTIAAHTGENSSI